MNKKTPTKQNTERVQEIRKPKGSMLAKKEKGKNFPFSQRLLFCRLYMFLPSLLSFIR